MSRFTVYALADPRTREARYVGQTGKLLGARLVDHCGGDLRKPTAKNGWLRELIHSTGEWPSIEELEVVQGTRKEAYAAETKWIGHLRAQGHRLLNSPIPLGQQP